MTARLYLYLVYALSLYCLWASHLDFGQEVMRSPYEVLLFIGLSAFAGGKKITVHKRRADSESVSMTLGFGITLAALINCGIGCAVLWQLLGAW